MTYSEKLKDPRWQKKRLKILERDEFSCKSCGDTEKTLNVHHIAYDTNPWDTEDKLLITLCEECHEAEEKILKEYSHKLFNELRHKGFMARGFRDLVDVFSKNRGWDGMYPSVQVLKTVVDDDNLWEVAHDLYFLRAVREMNNPYKDKE